MAEDKGYRENRFREDFRSKVARSIGDSILRPKCNKATLVLLGPEFCREVSNKYLIHRSHRFVGDDIWEVWFCQTSRMNLPCVLKSGATFQLQLDGKPTILLGGQVHNSSTSTISAIANAFDKVKQLNYNFVIAPVSWAQFESEEGQFDTTLVQEIIRVAEQNYLKVALIWFGAFKNAKSSYAPSWVRQNTQRFPRALTSPGGKPSAAPTLSVFSDELAVADTKAFTGLVTHLRDHDPNHTVVMIQIENEVGLLGASRDYSENANLAWEQSGLKESWQDHEKFMAEHFAKYCNRLALAGKAVKNLPMFVNAWLGPQPGQEQAGQWPSGGPSSLVLDVWKQHAPDIDILSPDIYVYEAMETMAIYHRPNNALFIPESRHIVGNLFWALGEHKAIGYAVFGAEDGRIGNQISSAYELLNQCRTIIARAQASDSIRAVIVSSNPEHSTAHFGALKVRGLDNLSGVKRFVEVAGVDLLVTDYNPASELEDLMVVIDSPGDTRPSALVIQESENSFILIGRGVNLDFSEPGFRVEIDSVESGHFANEVWICEKVLNGDERMNFLPLDKFGCARVRLLKISEAAD